MNIRIKFQRYGTMKFIGHLDMMRYFQKAIRRADIDIAYSGGYSPHPIMSFAAPLGVGITSDGEYFDIAANSTRSSQDSIEALNHTMAEGISVLEYKKLPDTAKPAMSLVAAADYLVYGKMGNELFENIQSFCEGQEQILITKQTKKQELQMDLKPLIYEMKAVKLGDKDVLRKLHVKSPEILDESSDELLNGLFLKVCTGSRDNVKPELVLEALCRFCGIPFHSLMFKVHRLEVYAKAADGSGFLTLGELGEDIK